MIPYVEVIGKYSLKPFAIIEPSQCWFEISYYEIGEFEVYCVASNENLEALKCGNYIKIPNKPYLWVIKSIEYTYSADGARMIDAKGFEAKWIINQRIIPNPKQLDTDLAEAVFGLVDENLGENADQNRTIEGFKAIRPTFSKTITDTQATRGNLWEFIANILKASQCGSYSYFDGNINFLAFEGRDLSDRIVFSQSMDNLISSNYFESSENKRTFAKIVSTQTSNDVTEESVVDFDQGGSNIDRLETLVASNISTKYKDESGVEQETPFGSQLYKQWQTEEGRNALAEQIIVKDFAGEIDLQNSQYEFEKDFFLGDIVKVKDEFFGYSAKARIAKYTFKQDASGYGEEADYGNE